MKVSRVVANVFHFHLYRAVDLTGESSIKLLFNENSAENSDVKTAK